MKIKENRKIDEVRYLQSYSLNDRLGFGVVIIFILIILGILCLFI